MPVRVVDNNFEHARRGNWYMKQDQPPESHVERKCLDLGMLRKELPLTGSKRPNDWIHYCFNQIS